MKLTILILVVLVLAISAQRPHRNRNRDRDGRRRSYNNDRDSGYGDRDNYNPSKNSNYDDGNYGYYPGEEDNGSQDDYYPTKNHHYGNGNNGDDSNDGENTNDNGSETTTTPTTPASSSSSSSSSGSSASSSSSSSSSSASSSDFVTQCLQYQNEFRAEVGSPDLTWSDTLAASAKSWAESMAASGDLVHSHGNYGENIAYGSSSYTLQRIFSLWTDEKADFIPGATFPDCTTGGVVGHYTQVVWKKTTQVGCGTATGSGRTYLACQYLPAGNMRGEKVY